MRTTTLKTNFESFFLILGLLLTFNSLGAENPPKISPWRPPPVPIFSLGTPVVSSRQWATAMAPNSRGGFNFITQSYEYPNEVPTEWVVVDLEAQTYGITQGPAGVYSNIKYAVKSEHIEQDNDQIRARNGRIFFPESGAGNAVNVAYYNPIDERVHQLPPLVDPDQTNAIVFNMVFNPSGSMLYGGTSTSSSSQKPMIFKLDPETLEMSIIGHVGSGTHHDQVYAYYLAVDNGVVPYLYTAIGQDHWELVSTNLVTGVSTVLQTTSGPGFQRVSFEAKSGGWQAQIWDNGILTNYWLGDGTLSPYVAEMPPFSPRTVTPYANKLVEPYQLDWSRGIGQVLWRPFGNNGTWNQADYEVTYKSPIPIQSLTALSDGTLMGNTEQYNGFFRVNQSNTTWNGAWSGLSQPATAMVHNLMYMAGYPNGVLYSFDPSQPWDVESNPQKKGYFTSSGMKYPYFLGASANGKLYCVGRRERDGTGSALGSYDLATSEFKGQNSKLNFYKPRGMAILNGPGRIVFSGEVQDDPAFPGARPGTAQLILYDYDLKEIVRQTVDPSMFNTGLIYPTAIPTVIVGVNAAGPSASMYRFDIATGTLLQKVPLRSVFDAVTQTRDRVIWAVRGNSLYRIDPETLTTRLAANLGSIGTVTHLAWQGPELYFTVDKTVYKVQDIPL